MRRATIGRDTCIGSNRLILENLRQISGMEIPMIIRLPFIPGINDDETNLGKTADFVTGLQTLQSIDLPPYHRLGEGKWRQPGVDHALTGLAAHTERELAEISCLFSARGIPVKIGG